jgi:diguanylate cyclase (GGDEF)-like protein/PAS domain S-box-containing protein
MEGHKTSGEKKSPSTKRAGAYPASHEVDETTVKWESLRTSEERLRTLIQTLPDAVVFKDATGRWMEANELAQQTFSIQDTRYMGLDTLHLAELSAAYRGSAHHCNDTDEQAWSAGKSIRFEQVIEEPNRSPRIFDVIKVPVFHDDGNRRGIVIIGRDITDSKASERMLSDSELRYRSLVQYHPDAVLTLDLYGNFLSINPAFERISGYCPQDLIGKSCVSMVIPGCWHSTRKYFTFTLRGEPVTYETSIRHQGGRVIQLRVTNIPMRVDGKIVGVYGICKDITEQKRAQEQIHRMAFYDSLTGLPNRSYLNKYMSELVLQDPQRNFSLIFIDLDDFKQMNDTFGHSEGDALLKLVAQCLEEVKRRRDLVVRWAGDEFLILVHDVSSTREVKAFSLSVLEALRKPFTVSGQQFYISASIGISMYPDDGEDAETLLRSGDTALQLAKKQGKNMVEVYKPSFHRMTSRNLQVGNALRTAVANGELNLHYQPKYNPYNGCVTGLEALLRWRSPTLGVIDPNEFIPLAEDTGMIVPIGQYVLQTACAQVKSWTDAGYGKVHVAVNISVRQIQQPDFVEMVQSVLDRTGLEASRLELEITESLLLRAEQGLSVLTALRSVGVKISFDDFGTGYSSLRYLQDVPIQAVKIDKSFVDQITTERGYAIVAAIIGLAQSLQLTVVAEGVETIQQVEVLKNLKCDEIQGFYYSRPIPSEQVAMLFIASTQKTS